MKRWLKIVLISVPPILIFLLATLYILIQPKENLDLNPGPVDLDTKLNYFENSPLKGSVTLTETDINNLLKSKLSTTLTGNNPISGVNLKLRAEEVQLDLNLSQSGLSTGVKVISKVDFIDNKLLFTPTEVYLGRLPLEPQTLIPLLKTYSPGNNEVFTPNNQVLIDIEEKLPPYIKINNIKITDGKLKVEYQQK